MAFGQGQGASSAQTVSVQGAGKQVLFGSLDRRKAILILGLGLLAVANLRLGAVWKSGVSGAVDQNALKNPLNGKGVLAELALLAALWLISFAGDDAANASLLIVLGLWAVWWMNSFAVGSDPGNPGQRPPSPPPGNGGGGLKK